MEIVKKNLISIICAAVVLIAIGATFWPIAGWFEDLRTEGSVEGPAEAFSQPRLPPRASRRLGRQVLTVGETPRSHSTTSGGLTAR